MKLFFILGNQLFPTKYLDRFKKDHLFFMAEDKGLCTYEKHHKQKILLFLSSMRSYADGLRKNKFKLDYFKIEDKEFNEDYLKKVKKKITEKTVFVIEASSYQLDYSKIFSTKFAIILNISADHLERHNTLNNYVNAKFKLLRYIIHTIILLLLYDLPSFST